MAHTSEKLTTVRVKDGPNDWEMWLCLRCTTKCVEFHTEERANFMPLKGKTDYLWVVITRLEKSNRVEDVWYVKGEVCDSNGNVYNTVRVGGISVPFEFWGTYNSCIRKGIFGFGVNHNDNPE